MDQAQTGKFIAELRKEHNLTQAELGEKLGVTNKTISKWENGNYMPDISVMEQMCSIFDISINELVSGKHLDENNFKESADHNLLSSMNALTYVKRQKRIIDFLGGAGTGILFSSLYSPDTWRRTTAIFVGILMIAISWHIKARYDKYVMDMLKQDVTDDEGPINE